MTITNSNLAEITQSVINSSNETQVELLGIKENQTDGTQKTQIVDNLGNSANFYESEDGKFAINIHDADVHNVAIIRHFIDFDSVSGNPSVAISSGDYIIAMSDTTGFISGQEVVIRDDLGDVREPHFDIISVVANTSITLNRPIDNDYTTSATIEVINTNLNVTGTIASPKIYRIQPPSDEVWHISRVIFNATNDVAMTDENFCGITKLQNGMILRENRTENNTWSIWQTTGDMAEDMYDVDYPTKVPAGTYAVRGRFTFKNFGVTARLDGAVGDKLEILVQDDLSSLTKFRIKAEGHIE